MIFLKIFEYLKDDKNLEPLIICGPSGCGKTSLIAKAAYSVNYLKRCYS